MRLLGRAIPYLLLVALCGCQGSASSGPPTDTEPDVTETTDAVTETTDATPPATDLSGASTAASTSTSDGSDSADPSLPCRSPELLFDHACDALSESSTEGMIELIPWTLDGHPVCWVRFESFESVQAYLQESPELTYVQACDIVVPTATEEAACVDEESSRIALRAQLGVPSDFKAPTEPWLPLLAIDGITAVPESLADCEAGVRRAADATSERIEHALMICATLQALLPEEEHWAIPIRFVNAVPNTWGGGQIFGTIGDLLRAASGDHGEEIVAFATVAWIRSDMPSPEERLFLENWPSLPGLTFFSGGNPDMRSCDDNTRPACPACFGDADIAGEAYRDAFVPVSGANRCREGDVYRRGDGAPYAAPYRICFRGADNGCTCRVGTSIAAPAAAATWLLARHYGVIAEPPSETSHGQKHLEPILAGLPEDAPADTSRPFTACPMGSSPDACASCPDALEDTQGLGSAIDRFLTGSGIHLAACGASPLLTRQATDSDLNCDEMNDLWSVPTAPRTTCNNCVCLDVADAFVCLLDPEFAAEDASQARSAAGAALELVVRAADGSSRNFSAGERSPMPLMVELPEPIDDVETVVLRIHYEGRVDTVSLAVLHGTALLAELLPAEEPCIVDGMHVSGARGCVSAGTDFAILKSVDRAGCLAVGTSLVEVVKHGTGVMVDAQELAEALRVAERITLIVGGDDELMLMNGSRCDDLVFASSVQCYDSQSGAIPPFQ